MRSWPTVSIPPLPPIEHELALFDTARGVVAPTAVGEEATMYVCGITPYDATHVGHATTYVTFDTVHRFWLATGHRVRYAQNVTDIDDPLLERADRDGVYWRALADAEIQRFRDDMTALRVLPPTVFAGVVEKIPAAADRVARLKALGASYDLDGDLYYSVTADPRFGDVSHLPRAEMILVSAERGGDPDRPGKRDPLDAVLWQGPREGEPAWDSPLGPGRPGWHIECATIALDSLGDTIDLQGGGSDLIFPHHEFTASQARTMTGQPFARFFVHAGMVAFQGEKMSKSRGNLIFISSLRSAGVDPMAIRLAILDRHYRSDWEWTDGLLDEAVERLAAWRAALSWPTGPDAATALREITSRVADDLDTPGALAAMDHWAQQQRLRGGDDPHAPGVLSRTIDALLGVA